MRKPLSLAGLALALASAPTFAQQSPNTTPSTVTRIVLVHVKPGHFNPFWADFRQHTKPIYDEEKRQGILTDWHVFTKQTEESADDWNVGIAQVYKNWAALDSVAARSDPITVAHYGSTANAVAANIARLEHFTVTSVLLLRDQTVNPWK
jgi:hypothetical protein